MSLPDALDAALDAIFGHGDHSERRAAIDDALALSRADYSRYRDGAAAKARRQKLAELGRLADRATAGRADAIAALSAHVGDGLEVDRLLDISMGYPASKSPQHFAARRFARASDGLEQIAAAGALAIASTHAWAFTAPIRRARRSRKFAEVRALACWYAAETGCIPTFSTDGDGARTGTFAALVSAVDATFGLDHGEQGFDGAIPKVLFAAAMEIETAAILGVGPAPLGSPSEIRRDRHNQSA